MLHCSNERWLRLEMDWALIRMEPCPAHENVSWERMALTIRSLKGGPVGNGKHDIMLVAMFIVGEGGSPTTALEIIWGGQMCSLIVLFFRHSFGLIP